MEILRPEIRISSEALERRISEACGIIRDDLHKPPNRHEAVLRYIDDGITNLVSAIGIGITDLSTKKIRKNVAAEYSRLTAKALNEILFLYSVSAQLTRGHTEDENSYAQISWYDAERVDEFLERVLYSGP